MVHRIKALRGIIVIPGKYADHRPARSRVQGCSNAPKSVTAFKTQTKKAGKIYDN